MGEGYTVFAGMASFEIIEHTADVGIEARGETVAQAFAQVAMGMSSLMVDLDKVEGLETREVEARAADLEALLVAWLNELIYLFDVEEMVFSEFHILEMDDVHLKARCQGEALDPEKHQFGIGPKAATYHMLEVRREEPGSGWRARVIVDI